MLEPQIPALGAAGGAPVLIAGAGPVGLSLAAWLTGHGVPVVVLERGAALSREARASTFHPPTLEMLAEAGVIDEMIERGLRVDELQYWDRASRALVASFSYELIADDTPYPFRLQLPQSELLRLLLPRVQGAETARVLFGHAVVDVAQHEHGVTALVEGPSGPAAIEGSWLVGCDGAHSAVRQQTGVPFTGNTYADRFLLVATDIDMTTVLPGVGPVAYLFDPDEWVIVMRQPGDLTRLVFRMSSEEDARVAEAPAAVRARVERFTGPVPFEVRSTSIYSVHQRVASSFRARRVLLAGDAAHVNNPAGGMGMNSGIHDAHLLAECLGRVWHGEDDGLLDAWAHERREVAVSLVQLGADRNYRDLVLREERDRAARDAALRVAASSTEAARAYLLKAAMLAARIGAQTSSPRSAAPPAPPSEVRA